MNTTTQIHAPAKTNLSLRVLGSREDGFHEIETIMVFLPGLHDTLIFEPSESFAFTCDDPSLPTDGSNLVIKAVQAYEKAGGSTCGFSIQLCKRIPHGAGLGGGSSDAAAVLKVLDQSTPKPLGPGKLLEVAASLGSDVPFFLGEGPARCTGRGEKIEPVRALPRLDILLLRPSFPVATADAYGRWKNSQELEGVIYGEQNLDGIVLVNDLERPVFAKHRFLAELKMWLLARDEVAGALLCGSGSTIMAILHVGASPEALTAAARHELDPHLWHWHGFTA